MDYYSYIHCKPDGTPFYVGKGTSRRVKYLGERNAYHKAVVNKYGKENILIGRLACSSEQNAYDLERGIIKCLFRSGAKLTNCTEGGEGGKNPTPETRKRLSEAAKKRGVSEACQLAKIAAKKGKPLSAEQKAKQSASMKGKVFTDEHKHNISISAKKRGIPLSTLAAAHIANANRIHSKEEKIKRGINIRNTLEQKNKTSKIKVDGIFYVSLADAFRITGIKPSSLLYGLRHSGYVKGHKVEYV